MSKLTEADVDRMERNGVGVATNLSMLMRLIAEWRVQRQHIAELERWADDLRAAIISEKANYPEVRSILSRRPKEPQ